MVNRLTERFGCFGFLLGKRRLGTVCSLCAQEIRAGETLWQRDGATVCTDCFLPFAREELRPFEYILGEEMAE